jgi:hypothetical protein
MPCDVRHTCEKAALWASDRSTPSCAPVIPIDRRSALRNDPHRLWISAKYAHLPGRFLVDKGSNLFRTIHRLIHNLSPDMSVGTWRDVRHMRSFPHSGDTPTLKRPRRGGGVAGATRYRPLPTPIGPFQCDVRHALPPPLLDVTFDTRTSDRPILTHDTAYQHG